jgi:hypothetical protein
MAASHGSHHKPFELMLPHSTQGCDGKSRRSFAATLNIGSLKIDKILSFQVRVPARLSGVGDESLRYIQPRDPVCGII